MISIIPYPQKLKVTADSVNYRAVKNKIFLNDERLDLALESLPYSEYGATLEIHNNGQGGEKYILILDTNSIKISANSEQGIFYAIQTLRQIFKNKDIPCMEIEDYPDFKYRGFYHDITRGKVPKLETLKKLVDNMAYYKLNSLQLYIEHTYEFIEYADSIQRTGYITSDELKELDKYCKLKFIELIPSLATFGHLYELLQKDRYKHLCELENFKETGLYWANRMLHHTIDPTSPESFELIKSLIDQFIPNFSSNKFNICCDETFDLKVGKHKDENTEKLYINFVNKIIEYLRSKGKVVMMWADIILNQPEGIDNLSSDVQLLNWDYAANPNEQSVKKLYELKRNQIVCPGTGTWSRLCENYKNEKENITKMADYGYMYNAQGVLNTNWGDWGNPCSIELSMYGLLLGAEKSWNVRSKADSDYEIRVNNLLYKNKNGVGYLREVSELQEIILWTTLAKCYSNCICEDKYEVTFPTNDEIDNVVSECLNLNKRIAMDIWEEKEYSEQLSIAVEGIAVMAELLGKFNEYNIQRRTNTLHWLKKYKENWFESNKASEFNEIEKMFLTLEKYCNK